MQTIGEPNVHASEEKHFYRPTFMAFQTDGSFYVADGYLNTRVVKFDKNGNYLTAWGQAGEAGKETAARLLQPRARRGGRSRDAWDRANLHFVQIDADRKIWVYDQVAEKPARASARTAV